MPANELEIIISSDISKGVPGVQQAGDALAGLGKAADNASGKFVRFDKNLVGTSGHMRGFISLAKLSEISYKGFAGSAGFARDQIKLTEKATNDLTNANNRLKASSTNANGALVGFTNIVRDAPYGIIGVGNNITQLTDAFRQLQVQTGSTRAALGATISSLFSPAGLFTVGLSTAISLWTVYSQRQQHAASSAKKAQVDIKGVGDIIAEGAVKLKEYNVSAIAEISILNRLYAVAADDKRSREERINALRELKNQTNGYLNTLTLETVGTDKARQALDRYNESLIRGAFIKAYEGQLTELATAYGKAEERAEQGKKALDEFNAAIIRNNKRLAGTAPDQEGFDRDQKNNRSRLEIIGKTNEAIKEQNRLQEELFKLSSKVANLQIKQNPFDPKSIKEANKVNPYKEINLDEINEILNQGRRQDIFQREPIKFRQPIDIELVGVQAAAEKLESQIKPVIDTGRKFAEVVTVDLENLFQQGAASIAKGVASAIGGLISGATDLQGALNSIVGVFADFISQLGEALIAAGTATLAAQVLSTNPATAIAAGALAIAAGAAIKSALNKAPSFATGGGVIGGPTLAMIGDNPGREEYVIPSEVLDKMGGGDGFIAKTEIQADKLALLVYRALQQEGRIN